MQIEDPCVDLTLTAKFEALDSKNLDWTTNILEYYDMQSDIHKLEEARDGNWTHSSISFLFETRSILERMLTWGNSSWTIAERDDMHPLINLVTSVIN